MVDETNMDKQNYVDQTKFGFEQKDVKKKEDVKKSELEGRDIKKSHENLKGIKPVQTEEAKKSLTKSVQPVSKELPQEKKTDIVKRRELPSIPTKKPLPPTKSIKPISKELPGIKKIQIVKRGALPQIPTGKPLPPTSKEEGLTKPIKPISKEGAEVEKTQTIKRGALPPLPRVKKALPLTPPEKKLKEAKLEEEFTAIEGAFIKLKDEAKKDWMPRNHDAVHEGEPKRLIELKKEYRDVNGQWIRAKDKLTELVMAPKIDSKAVEAQKNLTDALEGRLKTMDENIKKQGNKRILEIKNLQTSLQNIAEEAIGFKEIENKIGSLQNELKSLENDREIESISEEMLATEETFLNNMQKLIHETERTLKDNPNNFYLKAVLQKAQVLQISSAELIGKISIIMKSSKDNIEKGKRFAALFGGNINRKTGQDTSLFGQYAKQLQELIELQSLTVKINVGTKIEKNITKQFKQAQAEGLMKNLARKSEPVDLIIATQRLPRWKMLLEGLKKHSPDENRVLINKGVERIDKQNYIINESFRSVGREIFNSLKSCFAKSELVYTPQEKAVAIKKEEEKVRIATEDLRKCRANLRKAMGEKDPSNLQKMQEEYDAKMIIVQEYAKMTSSEDPTIQKGLLENKKLSDYVKYAKLIVDDFTKNPV